MEPFHHSVRLRVIRCRVDPRRADQLGQGTKELRLELSALVGRQSQRGAEEADPVVVERPGDGLSLLVRYWDSRRPSRKAVNGCQAVLKAFDERQLDQVQVDVIKAGVWG